MRTLAELLWWLAHRTQQPGFLQPSLAQQLPMPSSWQPLVRHAATQRLPVHDWTPSSSSSMLLAPGHAEACRLCNWHDVVRQPAPGFGSKQPAHSRSCSKVLVQVQLVYRNGTRQWLWELSLCPTAVSSQLLSSEQLGMLCLLRPGSACAGVQLA